MQQELPCLSASQSSVLLELMKGSRLEKKKGSAAQRKQKAKIQLSE
jgi:hypothetical protein